jgi:TFIIF-interacting CTD phosphatase-like protein
MLEQFEAPPASYNIPQEYMTELTKPTHQVNSNIPFEKKISNSKLPDDIKRLMMEHPIQQPTMGMSSGAVLSNELVEKASRLMNSTSSKNGVNESKNTTQINRKQPTSQSINMEEIKDVIRETVQEVLYENGLLVESTKDSSEMFKFRVGQHIFEGKVTKIRKITK